MLTRLKWKWLDSFLSINNNDSVKEEKDGAY